MSDLIPDVPVEERDCSNCKRQDTCHRFGGCFEGGLTSAWSEATYHRLVRVEKIIAAEREAREKAERERDEWKAKAEIKNPSECDWDTLGSRCLAAEAERDAARNCLDKLVHASFVSVKLLDEAQALFAAEREKVKALREESARQKEEAAWRRKAFNSYHAGELDAGAAVASLIYVKGEVTDADVQALAATEGRVDEIRDELGPERVPAAAVERIMKLEDNLEALRSYTTQTGRTQCAVPNVSRRPPVSEWPKAERDEWLLDLCEAHWDGMMRHPRGGERPDRTYCPLCQEYGYSCRGCPLGSCQNAYYIEAMGAFNLLHLSNLYEDDSAYVSYETWREKAGAMIEHIREVRRGVVEERRSPPGTLLSGMKSAIFFKAGDEEEKT